MDVMQKICQQQQELFFKGYGDPNDTKSVSGTLPIDASKKWVLVAGISKTSMVRIINTDAANALEYTFNDKDSYGAYSPKGTIEILEPIRGSLYMRSADGAATCTFNVLIMAVNTQS